MTPLARLIAARLRHSRGWSTNKKLLVLNVDDYGNVRLASKKARDSLAAQISGFGDYMDQVDALETREDLEALFDVLTDVHDSRGQSAVMTAYSLCANPDFAHIRKERQYACEALPTTFARCAAEQPKAYEGAWTLWSEGVEKGIFRPQFHGREHVNVALINAKLARGDSDLEANLHEDSMAGLSGIAEIPGVGFTHAFGGDDPKHLDGQRQILRDGIERFEKVFGFRSLTFTPPAQKLNPSLEHELWPSGILTLDRPFVQRRKCGLSKKLPRLNFPSPPRAMQTGTIVRTVSFEPCQATYSDPVGHALAQIDRAFRASKPAVVSSHRANFAGHIEPSNRRNGLMALKELLQRIVLLWPDVCFVSADELVEEMQRQGSISR